MYIFQNEKTEKFERKCSFQEKMDVVTIKDKKEYSEEEIKKLKTRDDYIEQPGYFVFPDESKTLILCSIKHGKYDGHRLCNYAHCPFQQIKVLLEEMVHK
ncbi:MAG: hypothetical protein PVF58_14155 [Candidatus Methanofastidiosia archaeon]|jgi:hypothetical protein